MQSVIRLIVVMVGVKIITTYYNMGPIYIVLDTGNTI